MIGISKLYCGTVEPSDALRYGRHSGKLPSHLLQFAEDKKPVVVWNMTRACNLKCAHCYAQATAGKAEGEMSTAEGKALIDDLADFGSPVILFSGGEPMMHPDLPELARYAVSKGMRAVISTNGTLIIDIADIRRSPDDDPLVAWRGGYNSPIIDQSGVVVTGLADSPDKRRWTFTGLARPFEANLSVEVNYADDGGLDVDWVGGVVDGRRSDNGVMTTTWTEAWGQFEFTIVLPDGADPGVTWLTFDPSGGASDEPTLIAVDLADYLN